MADNDIAKEYEDFGKEVDDAVEANRSDVEDYYAEQAAQKEERNRKWRVEKYGRLYGYEDPLKDSDSEEEEALPGEAPETAEVAQAQPAEQEAPEVEEVEEEEKEEKKTAAEVVDEIEASDSADEVRSLAEGDDRKTVQKAAEKRLDELESE